MKRSEPIFPVPIYDDFANQHRFDKFCETNCGTQLNYPTNGLPSFQFKRPLSLLNIDTFIIRNVCSDEEANFYKKIPEAAANMASYAYENTFGEIPIQLFPGPEAYPIAELTCGKLKSIKTLTSPASLSPGDILVPTWLFQQRFKIVVDEFANNSGNFQIRIMDGAVVKQQITRAGSYTIDFIPVNPNITIKFYQYNPTQDYFTISYIQSQLIDIRNYASFVTDVELDASKIKVVTLTGGSQVIVYCDPLQDYTIKPGDYYFYMRFSDIRGGGGGGGISSASYEWYFSEVFTVKSVKDIENYYRLKWWNKCDIGTEAIYDTSKIEGCEYRNTVYVNNSELFKPEYPVDKKEVENGKGVVTALTTTWKKQITLEVPMSPEFLTDALTSIVLHSNKYLLEPLNRMEEKQVVETEIKEISTENTDVMNDCYQKVDVTCVLNKTITNSRCCDDAELFNDHFYRYTSKSDCSVDYKLIITIPPASGDGLKTCTGNIIVPVKPLEIIRNLDDGKFYTLEYIDDIWQVVNKYPLVKTKNLISGTWHLTGAVIPHTVAVLEFNKDSHGWYESGDSKASDSSGDVTLTIKESQLVGATDVKVRIKDMVTGSVLGYSDAFDLI